MFRQSANLFSKLDHEIEEKQMNYDFIQFVNHYFILINSLRNLFYSINMDRHRAGSYPVDPYQEGFRPDYASNPSSHFIAHDYENQKLYQHTQNDQAYKYTPKAGQRVSTPINFLEGQRKNLIRSKIQEIVKLCSDENAQIGNELQDVSAAQKQILNLIKENSRSGHSRAQQQNPNKQPDHAQIDQERGTTFGPIRQNTFSNSEPEPQRQYNKYKKSAIDDLKTQRNNQEVNAEYFGLQSQNIREKLQGNPYMSDDALEMIQSIERKAIEQIDALRQDKVSLMRKLNHEIKAHNKEKKLRLQLEAQAKRLRALLEQHGITEGKSKKKQTTVSKAKRQISRPGRQSNGQNYQQPSNENINMVNSPIHEHQQQEEYDREEKNNNLVREIQSLEYENYQMKNNLSGSKASGFQSPSFLPNKEQLLAEVNNLRATMKQYEMEMQMLRVQNNSDPEIDRLLQQGQELRRSASRIMNSKNGGGMTAQERNSYLRQIEEYRKKIDLLHEENTYLGNKSSQFQQPTQNYNTYQSSIDKGYQTNRNYNLVPDSYRGNSTKKISEYQSLLGQIRRVNNM